MASPMKVTVINALAARVTDAAAADGVTVTEWIADAIRAKLGDVPDAAGCDPLPERLPSAIVIVRLAPAANVGDGAGWKPDMSDEQWWQAAHGEWHLGIRARAEARYLAVADPDRIIRRLWKVADWSRSETRENRFLAVGGTPVTTKIAADRTEKQLAAAVLEHVVPAQRNPVIVRYPTS